MSENTNTKSTSASAEKAPLGLRRRRSVVMVCAAVGVLAIGIGTAFFLNTRDTPVVDAGPARVDVATVEGFGDVLVDGQGRTLYLFEPDEAAQVTCTGGCADKWPPLVATDPEPEVGTGIDATMVATVKDQAGERVLTFDGWPLYRYTSDDIGEITGTDKDQNGGVWWALTPTGERVQNR